MPLVAERQDLSKYNITEDETLFSSPEFGALYISPEENFADISQATLSQLVEMNQQQPLKGYNENQLEFFPDDIFIEKSYKDINKAEQFIKDFFAYFEIIDPRCCEEIIKKLHKFVKISPSGNKIHCRLEVISGDSCKKFHVDNVESRLIYTCAGPGTQIKHPESNNFTTLPTGSALVVKGQKYPQFKLTTLHRSPPIAEKKLKRFLFIADYV